MALNDYDQNNKKEYKPTHYSNYRMSNIESTVDQTVMTFTYWNGALKISIVPLKPGSNAENVAFDYDNAIDIYLNHSKAYILASEIERFMADPERFNSSGVPSGQGLITISNGKEFGIDCPCMVVRKIDEQGLPTSYYVYQFKNDYHFSVRNYDAKQGSFDKVTDDYADMEIYQLKLLLEEYYKAMTGAVAYSVVDANRYEQRKIMNSLNSICDKLGIQSYGNGGHTKSSTSVFANSKPTNYSSASLSSVDSIMYEEE